MTGSANSINVSSQGVVQFDGNHTFSSATVNQYAAVIGAANNTITSVSPSATSGIALVSQGASANPAFSTVAIAGGGTNATSFTQSNGIVTYNGTSLVNYAGPQISASGVYTNTTQPAFYAYLGSSVTNATGNSTTFQIGSGTALTVLFDRGSNFNTNGTFTAPVSGVYNFSGAVSIGNLVAGTNCNLIIVAGGRNYRLFSYNPVNMKNIGSGNCSVSGTVTVFLNASETAVLQINNTGEGADTNTVVGSATNLVTSFSGFLVG